ncbi:MAG TPA: PilW family protein, partial [Thauera sp.]|nr:PilW family protein [Thauera sp.]
MKPTPKPSFRRQLGMTIVELMIAMTIGLVILGAVSTLFINVQLSVRNADSMSRIQENARFAIELMARDIRMAGYIGCGNLASGTINTIANAPVPQLNAANAIRGQDAPSGTIAGITLVGGDTFTIMRGTGSDVHLVGNLLPDNANIQINSNPDGFAKEDVLMVTNCSNTDVFRVTNNPSSGGSTTLTHAEGTNTGNRIGTYGPDAFVMRLARLVYFVGTNPDTNRPSLYRANTIAGAGVAEELVDNVENMEVEYGIDTNNDNAADEYRAAAAVSNWESVISVRLRLLVASAD